MSTTPGARCHSVVVAGGRVVAEDHARRRVVGVDEPRLVAALGPLDQTADGAEAGQVELPNRVAEGQVVHGDLADRVPRPGQQEDRLLEGRAVKDGDVVDDRGGVLGDELLPAGIFGESGVSRVGDGDPAAGRVAVASGCRTGRPARRAGQAVASTPSCITWRLGAAASPADSDRSAIHTSLRGAVPAEAVIVSQRPSWLTATP